jgi:glycosyltransferase involved in cell wall biosynthesis
MTEIAVLLPCYNPKVDELTLTLNSLRQQTAPFRLYLVDDGSKFQFEYEKYLNGIDAVVLRLPKNLGITGALNAGLQKISLGPYRYVVRIDCGDAAMPERFIKQKIFMDANPEIGIVGSAVAFKLFDAHGTLKGEKTLHFPLTHDACMKRLFLNSAIIHPAMMFRRAVFDRLKVYSEDFPAAEDYEILWRTAHNGFRLANLPEVLLVKEETPGSISQMRRRRQIYSRLKLQLANFNASSLYSWIGIAKSIVTWAAPAWVVTGFKFFFK